eukprot:g21586.t1
MVALKKEGLLPEGPALEALLCADAAEKKAEMKDEESISECQPGFPKGNSGLTDFLEFFEDVTSQVDDNGDPVDVVCRDFQKAFDKVLHERPIQKFRLFFTMLGDIISGASDEANVILLCLEFILSGLL